MINNIIHGFGQSGIDLGSGEYFYVLHNVSYNNSGVTCDAQGSGIGIVVPKAFADYKQTPADFAFGPFHNVVAWNVSHDNQLTKCGTAANPYDTDGNGIIMDTFNGAGRNNVIYPYQSLVAFNVTYRNGAKGIHVFRTNNVTVANNTAYDNNFDPFNRGTARQRSNLRRSEQPRHQQYCVLRSREFDRRPTLPRREPVSPHDQRGVCRRQRRRRDERQ